MRRGFGWGVGHGVGHGIGGAHVWGGIAMIAFWAVIVIAIVVLVMWLVRHRHYVAAAPVSGGAAPGAETPLDVIRRRYAAGEIDKAEYEEKKKDLAT